MEIRKKENKTHGSVLGKGDVIGLVFAYYFLLC